ncbi:VWA domain-containing protein [Actinosynnema pretiosum subsp. pretiosum]|uniref:VWA domain-containing protein n=1 Tax=Actinosynnema pretiosum subsp. pretiosum TaxID=103721 RepID=A0AA45L5G4_9PSEU|nr:Putative surface-anchored fimbrial subunit [Actinosynnema pretiosum subsp. pretiosum]QUF03854.1 VWA domain-containing protein [Actinosynnema pretiosum subsp. pretiosum]
MFGRTFALFAVAMLVAPLAAGAAQGAPNPQWPAECPLSIGLLIDESSSMQGRFDDVREATRNVVDSLRDKPSKVTIIEFGTTAQTFRAGVDASDADARGRLKEDVDLLRAGEEVGGATNWDAGLSVAEAHGLDLVVLITDGQPTVYGDPATEGPLDPLAIAVDTADRLKRSGTRLVAVGIDLEAGGEANLAAVTGPQVEQDYYVGEQSSLLRRLYDIVARACGVPFEALPKPEPPLFPWRDVLIGTLAVAALITLLAYLAYRRRRVPAAAPVPVRRTEVVQPAAIDHGHLARRVREESRARDLAPGGSGVLDRDATDGADEPGRGVRRPMPLDFLDRKPPTNKDNNP